MKIKYAMMIFLSFFCLSAYGAVGNDKAYHNANDSFNLFYELGNRNQYLCVGRLKNGGSAVWIGGIWAVTNAHCIDWNLLENGLKQTMKRDMDQNNVLTITTRDEQIEIPVIGAYKPEKLLEKDKYGPDIALIKLAFIPRARNLAPAILSNQEDILDKEIVCSGYGTLGLGSTGPDGNRFKRPHPDLRFGFQNKLEHYTNGGFVVRFTFDEKGLPLEGCLSAGDSGSGMFAMIDSKWQLVGINAHSETGPNGKFYQKSPVYGSFDGGIRVALFYPELQKAVKDNNPTSFSSLAWDEMQSRIKRTAEAKKAK